MWKLKLFKLYGRYYCGKTRFLMLTIALCLISPQYAWTQQPQGPWSGHFDFKQTAPPITEEKTKAIDAAAAGQKLLN